MTLQPAPFFEAVNVTSSRTDVPRADPRSTVTVLSSSELLTSAALTLDDALKMVPGFTLFRRTSSRVSNPTAQGVTLRGLGGTGASRSLVLADGVPLNDAFGGWVYWDKLPQVAIDRVEVLRGSGSDLYGADAVGGVVQILTWHPSRRAARALVEGGGLKTGRISLFGGGRSRGWSYTAGGEWFTTEGYIPVARGAGSRNRPARSDRFQARLEASIRSGIDRIPGRGMAGTINVSGNVFTDNRLNGTPAVINDTASRQGTSEIAGGLVGGLAVCARVRGHAGLRPDVFGGLRRSDERRSQPAAACTDEIRGTGGAVGAAVRTAHGARRSRRKVHQGRHAGDAARSGRVLATLDNGGTQEVWSTFVQDTFLVSDRLTVVVGAHGDRWHTRIAEHQLQQDARIVQSARVAGVSPRRRHLASWLRLQRLSSADVERALSRLQGRQHADESERGARAGKADRR